MNDPSISNSDHILAEIRRNLHHPRGSRAAVMVGAGFSRNAVPIMSNYSEFPSWSELTQKLHNRLYPESESEAYSKQRTSHLPSEALRLAQEFEVAFGRPALIELVRTAVPDDEFVPGPLHRRLLELPWADVFTTNYDCQLEKASREVQQRQYSVVHTVADLPIAGIPRIVKLHGTLPDLTDMILTEDDFRTYRRKYAPFVNLVGTSLAEKSLCLIGFSGNDPNFLEWSGWVRDELGNSAPYIYFFTQNVRSLKPFQRQLLEQRRIIPIDIRGLFQPHGIREAYEELFRRLSEKPGPKVARWNTAQAYAGGRSKGVFSEEPLFPKSDDRDGWTKAMLLWRKHRLQYQGWVVLPLRSAKRLSQNAYLWMGALTPKILKDWLLIDKIFLARELAWRFETCSVPLDDNFVYMIIDPALEEFDQLIRNESHVDAMISESILGLEDPRTAVRYLRLQCLRHAREIGDDDRFHHFDKLLQCEHLPQNRIPDDSHFLTYQHILRLLGRLEHADALTSLKQWNTGKADPIWKVRQAGLYLECGQLKLAKSLLKSAFKEVRLVSPESTNIREMSTEGVLDFLQLCVLQAEEWHQQPHRPSQERGDLDNAKEQDQLSEYITDLNRRRSPQHDVDRSGESQRKDHTPIRSDSPLEDELTLNERINYLSQFGCEPLDRMYWLRDVLEFRPVKPLGRIDLESFNIGQVTQHIIGGDNPPLKHAYEAIRFLEDSGIPIRIERKLGLNIADKLYSNATMTIAENSSSEAIGLALRSRDPKLLKNFLSRDLIARATINQIEFLYSVAITTLQTALSRISPPSSPQTDDDHWHERQFELACIILDRVIVRLSQDRIRAVLAEILPLSWDDRLKGRIAGYSDLIQFISRCAGLLNSESLSQSLDTLVCSPVLGEGAIPRTAVKVGKWVDPIEATDEELYLRNFRATRPLLHRIDQLIMRVSKGDKHERPNAISRLLSLTHLIPFNLEQKKRFVDAIYKRVDELGIPKDTNILASFLLLSLPRHQGVNERQLFRRAFLEREPIENNDWRVLAWTVGRFGPPRKREQRSIPWTKSDINLLLERAILWIREVGPSCDTKTHTEGIDFFGLKAQQKEEMNLYYRGWIETIEEVVLLSPKVSSEQIKKTVRILDEAGVYGLTTVKTLPSLCFLKQIESESAVHQIRNGLTSRVDETVWHACYAIARWAELTRQYRSFPFPKQCLKPLSTLILEGRHRTLALLLRTAQNVFEILTPGFDDEFLRDILTAFDFMVDELNYLNGTADFTINRKIILKQSILRIVNTLRTLGIQHETLERWIALGRGDSFEDVRRLC